MSLINFKIVTPSGVAYQDEIDHVTLPTADGEITVYAHHIPLVSLLRPGEMTVVKLETGDGTAREEEHRTHFAVARGIVEVRPPSAHNGGEASSSEVIILSDTADRAEEIDIAEAQAARDRAEEALKNKDQLDDLEFSRFRSLLEREITRIKVGGKYR